MKTLTKKNTAKATNGFAEEPKFYKTANDLPMKSRVEINTLLNKRLADAVDLHMQMKQAHWNVKGPNFIGLHKLFDEIHEATGEYVDTIAERAVQLGGVAEGTVRISAKRTTRSDPREYRGHSTNEHAH